MALGSMFGGFWDQVGRQVGVKLALKPIKFDTKTMSKNHQIFGHAAVTRGSRNGLAVRRSPGP